MTAFDPSGDKVFELRAAFDRSFAEAVADAPVAELDFLAIRVAAQPYALRLSEIVSLHVDRRLVAAPSPLPELLGIAGLRGELTPVYDLAALLGHGPTSGATWLAIARAPSAIGFAFDAFDSHLRVTPDRISAQGSAQHGAIQHAGVTLPLIVLPSLVEGIAERIKAARPSQER